MRESSVEQMYAQIDFLSPRSLISAALRQPFAAANTNRSSGHADHPFGYNPKAVAEAEQLAVEAMYLGADILELLTRVDLEISKEMAAETARLARTLMFWGVGAIALASRAV